MGEKPKSILHRQETKQRKGIIKHLLTSTSGQQFIPDIPGKELGITSDEALELGDVPESVCIVGDSYIALEFACLFNGLGTETHVVQRQPKVLRGFDEEARAQLATKGVEFHTECLAVAIERETTGHLALTTDKGERVTTKVVIYVTGRKSAAMVSNPSCMSLPSIWEGGGDDWQSLLPVAWNEAINFVKVVFREESFSPCRRYVPFGTAGLSGMQDGRQPLRSKSASFLSMLDESFGRTLTGVSNNVLIGVHKLCAGGEELIELVTGQSMIEAMEKMRDQLLSFTTPYPVLHCLISGQGESFCIDAGLGEYRMDGGYERSVKDIMKTLQQRLEKPCGIHYDALAEIARVLGMEDREDAAAEIARVLGMEDHQAMRGEGPGTPMNSVKKGADDASKNGTTKNGSGLSSPLSEVTSDEVPSEEATTSSPSDPGTINGQDGQTLRPVSPAQFHLFCPFSHQLMECPVRLKETGITFERSAIEDWLEGHSTCPLTGTLLKCKELVVNETVRRLCDEYRLQHQAAGNSNSCKQRTPALLDPPRHTSVQNGTGLNLSGLNASGLMSTPASTARASLDATPPASPRSCGDSGPIPVGRGGRRPSSLSIPTSSSWRDGPLGMLLSPSLRTPCSVSSSYSGGGGLASPSLTSSPTGSASGQDYPANYSECKARVQKLVADLNSSADAEKQRIVAEEVRRLAADSWETRACLYYGKIVPVLMGTLRKSVEPEVQLAALRALFNMLMDSTTKEALVHLGGVQMLLKLVSRSNQLDVREEAAGCLYSLSVLDVDEELAALRPALAPLIEIAKVASPKGRDDALKALWNLSVAKANKQIIANEGCIPFLLQLLADREGLLDRKMMKVVASLLDRVAKCREGQWAIASAGGIPKLAALISKADCPEQVKEYVIGVLDSLWMDHDSAILNVVDTTALTSVTEKGTERGRKKAGALLEKMGQQQDSLLKQIHMDKWEHQERWGSRQQEEKPQAVPMLQAGPSSVQGYGSSSFVVATAEADSGFVKLRSPAGITGVTGAHQKTLSRPTLQRLCIDKSYSSKY